MSRGVPRHTGAPSARIAADQSFHGCPRRTNRASILPIQKCAGRAVDHGPRCDHLLLHRRGRRREPHDDIPHRPNEPTDSNPGVATRRTWPSETQSAPCQDSTPRSPTPGCATDPAAPSRSWADTSSENPKNESRLLTTARRKVLVEYGVAKKNPLRLEPSDWQARLYLCADRFNHGRSHAFTTD